MTRGYCRSYHRSWLYYYSQSSDYGSCDQTLGLTDTRIRLHPEVSVSITVNIARSLAEAETQLKTGVAVTGETNDAVGVDEQIAATQRKVMTPQQFPTTATPPLMKVTTPQIMLTPSATPMLTSHKSGLPAFKIPRLSGFLSPVSPQVTCIAGQ